MLDKIYKIIHHEYIVTLNCFSATKFNILLQELGKKEGGDFNMAAKKKKAGKKKKK